MLALSGISGFIFARKIVVLVLIRGGFGVIANAAKRSAAIFLVFYGILFALFGKTIDCTTSVLILNCRMQNHWRTMCARFSFVQACSALGVTLTG